MTHTELSRRVRAHISQAHRYAHVVRTARFAEMLAYHNGASTTQARLAGMLHDLARLYPATRLLEECERRGIPIDAFARENPIVLHAPLGAEIAREQFGVIDPAVLSAIRKHTLGDAGMSRLDTILYLADALEPGRDYADRAALANIAQHDLNAALRATLASTRDAMLSRGRRIAPQTLAALAFYNA
jgi:predicted HD superfamily hydrolase involved in NAD metabolism